MSSRPSRYCRACGYPVARDGPHPCPECGRIVSLENRRTTRRRPYRLRMRLFWIGLLSYCLLYAYARRSHHLVMYESLRNIDLCGREYDIGGGRAWLWPFAPLALGEAWTREMLVRPSWPIVKTWENWY